MVRTRIKICGVRDASTALTAAQAGADAIGLVFAPGSPRLVDIDQARRIADALPPFVEPVGLFVDASTEHIRDVAAQVGLRTVQLHGDESPDMVAALSPLRVVKAIGFDPRDAANRLQPWLSLVNHLAGVLWDAPTQGAGSPTRPQGGTGQPLDWAAVAQAQRSDDMSTGTRPIILAGGLTPDNVGQAIQAVQPYGVDVSSGVESARGIKDAALIRAFCNAVRRADSQA